MSPRARRSESITLPPGNQPGLIRYNDDIAAARAAAREKAIKAGSQDGSESDSDFVISDDPYDTNDTDDSDYDSRSAAIENKDCGR